MHIDQKNRSFIVLLLVCDDDSHTVVSFGPHILCSAPTCEVDVWVISDNTVPVWPLTSLPPPSRQKSSVFTGFFIPSAIRRSLPGRAMRLHLRQSRTRLSASLLHLACHQAREKVSVSSLWGIAFSRPPTSPTPPGAPLSSARSEFSPKGGGAE